MVTAQVSHARDAAFHLLRPLNGGQAKPKFAYGGSMALHLHGVPVSRPVGDLDIVAVEPVKSAAGLRRVLVDAGCENLPSPRSFPQAIRNGRVPFVFDGLACEILSQHHRAATAIPPQAKAATKVMEFTRENICRIDDVFLLDIDAIVIWQALFNRRKDREAIAELVTFTRPDGKPAIRNREQILNLVIANTSEYGDEAKLLKETLWQPWCRSYI